MGEAVLAYRAHEAAGWTVLCTAAVTSKKFGVDVEAQRWLLHEILKRTAESAPSPQTAPDSESAHSVENIAELLIRNEQTAPAVVLAVALNDGDRDGDRVSRLLKRIGFALSEEEIHNVLKIMPEQPLDQIEAELKSLGWGSYLRQGRRALAEGGVE